MELKEAISLWVNSKKGSGADVAERLASKLEEAEQIANENGWTYTADVFKQQIDALRTPVPPFKPLSGAV